MLYELSGRTGKKLALMLKYPVTGLNLARRWTLLVRSAGRLSAYRQTQIVAKLLDRVASRVNSFIAAITPQTYAPAVA